MGETMISRATKRTWRRRLSRARHSRNSCRRATKEREIATLHMYGDGSYETRIRPPGLSPRKYKR